MVKCDICKEKVNELFLGKIEGSYFKKDGKKKVVCSNCQRKYKEEVMNKL